MQKEQAPTASEASTADGSVMIFSSHIHGSLNWTTDQCNGAQQAYDHQFSRMIGEEKNRFRQECKEGKRPCINGGIPQDYGIRRRNELMKPFMLYNHFHH